MQETPQERSDRAPDVPRSQRTEWNVRDSDATLILRGGPPTGRDPGTELTRDLAAAYARPVLVVDPSDDDAFTRISTWLTANGISTLDVAGPSESTQPGVGGAAYALLVQLFSAR
jgi:hypothetical protein